MRSALIVLAFLLAPSLITATPVGATTPLAVDAGASQWAVDGASLGLSASIFGGRAPYTVAWSLAGNSSRFSPSSATATTFATAGLAAGDYAVRIDVTDADGQVANDTVVHRVDVTSPFATVANISVGLGVSVGLVGVGSDAVVSFTVPSGLGRLTATLSWTSILIQNDLDVDLRDPSGASVAPGQGKTGSMPEVVVIGSPVAGVWTAHITPFLATPSTATLILSGTPSNPIPVLDAPLAGEWGQNDTQALHADATGGTGNLTFHWDLDGDGLFDTTGQDVTASNPTGRVIMRTRVVDDRGFRADARFQASVYPAQHALWSNCGHPKIPWSAMEFSASRGTCWIHGGHHTYYYGAQPWSFQALDGIAFTVEQQFAPSAKAANARLAAPVTIETSLDGQNWSVVELLDYRYVSLTDENGAIRVPPMNDRQLLVYNITGDGRAFRFLRFHVAPSITQGLSGYLDATGFTLQANVLPAVTLPAPAFATREVRCDDGSLMEDFVPEHPCTFGGVDRYDSASFFHTYVAGPGAAVDRVGGSFVLAPFRTDDWFAGADPVETLAYVQVSADGIAWTDVATVPALYGVPAKFSVAVPHVNATFVRLFPEYHADFDDHVANGPLHHARGYFVASNLTLEGDLSSF